VTRGGSCWVCPASLSTQAQALLRQRAKSRLSLSGSLLGTLEEVIGDFNRCLHNMASHTCTTGRPYQRVFPYWKRIFLRLASSCLMGLVDGQDSGGAGSEEALRGTVAGDTVWSFRPGNSHAPGANPFQSGAKWSSLSRDPSPVGRERVAAGRVRSGESGERVGVRADGSCKILSCTFLVRIFRIGALYSWEGTHFPSGEGDGFWRRAVCGRQIRRVQGLGTTNAIFHSNVNL